MIQSMVYVRRSESTLGPLQCPQGSQAKSWLITCGLEIRGGKRDPLGHVGPFLLVPARQVRVSDRQHNTLRCSPKHHHVTGTNTPSEWEITPFLGASAQSIKVFVCRCFDELVDGARPKPSTRSGHAVNMAQTVYQGRGCSILTREDQRSSTPCYRHGQVKQNQSGADGREPVLNLRQVGQQDISKP